MTPVVCSLPPGFVIQLVKIDEPFPEDIYCLADSAYFIVARIIHPAIQIAL